MTFGLQVQPSFALNFLLLQIKKELIQHVSLSLSLFFSPYWPKGKKEKKILTSFGCIWTRLQIFTKINSFMGEECTLVKRENALWSQQGIACLTQRFTASSLEQTSSVPLPSKQHLLSHRGLPGSNTVLRRDVGMAGATALFSSPSSCYAPVVFCSDWKFRATVAVIEIWLCTALSTVSVLA